MLRVRVRIQERAWAYPLIVLWPPQRAELRASVGCGSGLRFGLRGLLIVLVMVRFWHTIMFSRSIPAAHMTRLLSGFITEKFFLGCVSQIHSYHRPSMQTRSARAMVRIRITGDGRGPSACSVVTCMESWVEGEFNGVFQALGLVSGASWLCVFGLSVCSESCSPFAFQSWKQQGFILDSSLIMFSKSILSSDLGCGPI